MPNGNGFAAIAENQADPNFWDPQPIKNGELVTAPEDLERIILETSRH